jgi:dolichol-phosphate mannosyltransferase
MIMNTSMNIAFSVIIPMYNEVDNVEPLLTELHNSLANFADYEIIVIDDGSNDGTLQRLNDLMLKMPQLRVLRHRSNYGQSAGVYTGVKHAKNPWIVTLDGDGQNDPADIPAMFNLIQNLASASKPILVVGHRNKRKDNWLRLVSSRIANNVRAYLLKDDCPDTGCGLKVFQREAFLTLPHFNHIHRFLPALFRRAGGEVINIPVQHRPRMLGRSKYGVMNRLWVGIVDIFGVVWLIRRPCRPEVEDGA